MLGKIVVHAPACRRERRRKDSRMKKICLIGAFDTKGPEYAFVRECILARGHEVLTVNTAVLGSSDLFPIDVEAENVAEAGGANLEQLREKKDRGEAMKVMCAGAPAVVKSLHDEGRIDGIIGMGGTGGTTVVTSAMRALPIGVPKVCVSTLPADSPVCCARKAFGNPLTSTSSINVS